MARKFTLQIIMDLASRIGANPGKAISRSNVSFFGTGPKNNPLFQNHLAGLENASAENLGDPKNLFRAIEDAVGWLKDGKLNSIQSEILGHNLSGINKVLNPPVLPSATITTLPRSGLQPRSDWANQKQGSGITGVKRLIKEGKIEDAWRKFDKGYKGNPADEKYFESFHPEAYKDSTKSKFFEGPITTTGPKGTRTWDFTKKSKLPEPGPFQGWKPSVVPKVNIPASKINHQIIADQYGIDVELIEGKDWVEVLEVIRKLGYAHGGLAEILQAPRSGMRIGGLGLLTRGIRNAFKRTHKAYDNPGADFAALMDNPSYLMSPVNMQKIKKLELYRKQLVRDIVRKEGGGEFTHGPKPEAIRADLQLLDDYIAQLKKKIQEVGYYGQGAAPEKALVQERSDLPFSKFVRDKFKHAEGGLAGILEV